MLGPGLLTPRPQWLDQAGWGKGQLNIPQDLVPLPFSGSILQILADQRVEDFTAQGSWTTAPPLLMLHLVV